MANRSKLINAKSQLLSDPENESIFNLLGRKCTTLATAVIQLYLAEEAVNRYTWNKHSCGVVCFVKDNPQKSYFFRLYDPKKQHMLWEQEIYNLFKYKAPRKFFHTFEAHVCQVGFNFASDDEASVFKTVVENKLMERLKHRNDKMNHRTLDGAQMLATAGYDKNNAGTVPLDISHIGSGQSSSGGTISSRKFADNDAYSTSANNSAVNKQNTTTTKKSTGKRKGKMKLKKTDISTPTQFQHVTHLGCNLTTGLDMLGEQAEVKEMLKAIGISDPSNEDEGTIKFIYDFVDTHGGINAVREDLARRQPQKPLPPRPSTPPLTTLSPAFPSPILGPRTPPPVNDNKMNVPPPLPPMSRGAPHPRQSPVEHILTDPLHSSVDHAVTTTFPFQSPADHALTTPFPLQSPVDHALTTPFPLQSPVDHALTKPFLPQSSVDHALTKPFLRQSSVNQALTKPFLRQSSVDQALTKPFLIQSSVDHALTKPFLRQSSVEQALTKPLLIQSSVDHALTKPFLLKSSVDHALTKPFLRQSSVDHALPNPFPLQSSVDPAFTTPSPIHQRKCTGAPAVSSPRPQNRQRSHSTKGLAPSPPVIHTLSHKSPPSSPSVTPAAPPPPPMHMDGVEAPLTLPKYGMSGLLDSIHMGTKLKHVDQGQGVTSSDSRDGLLSQIRGGTTLKPVDYTDSQTPVQQPNDILGALAAALAQRKNAIQGLDDMDDNSDDDDDEDDDDEWDY